MKQPVKVLTAAVLSMLTSTTWASEAAWSSLKGKEALTAFISGLKVERTLPNGEISRGEYRADGTGTLFSWGEAFDRTWRIEGEDRLCISARASDVCYLIERNADDKTRYRARDVATGQTFEFRVTEQAAAVDAICFGDAGKQGCVARGHDSAVGIEDEDAEFTDAVRGRGVTDDIVDRGIGGCGIHPEAAEDRQQAAGFIHE